MTDKDEVEQLMLTIERCDRKKNNGVADGERVTVQRLRGGRCCSVGKLMLFQG
jgi:hypothetical protein